jgi:hypothetical protein
MSERIQSFEEFWPYYLREHSLFSCRVLHYVGTVASLAMVGVAAYYSPWWLLAVPVLGYGPAWIGHFFIEKNRPATFTYPLWSLLADYRMFGLAMTGRLGPELARALSARPTGAATLG